MVAVRYEREGPVARVTLDAPPRNTLSVAFLDDLLAALREAGRDEAVRAVVLSSSNLAVFSAGLDLKALAAARGATARALLQRLYLDLWDAQHELGKPSIAAVEGAARGGGLTLSISCNLIVAAEDASFGYPEIDIGLMPAIHLVHLPGIVGRHQAFDLLFTARTFGAREAHGLGLVSRLAPPGEALERALELASTLARKPLLAMAAAHRTFMRSNDDRARIAAVVDDFCALAEGEESALAIERFLSRNNRPL